MKSKKQKQKELARKASLLIKKDRAMNVSSIKIARAMALTGMFSLVVFTTSCSTSFDAFGNSDLQISGNEHGFNSFFDGLSSVAMNAKAKENIPTDTPDHEARRLRDNNRTLRKLGYKPMNLKPKKIQ